MFSFRRRREARQKLQNFFVATPCSMKWSDMTGDESVRFCHDCKLNVYNLSSMSDQDAVALIDRRKTGERICTYFYRKDDGTIATDNCPKRLKIFKTKMQSYMAATVLALCWMWCGRADAQGLVGAPVDPRYGQSNEIGQLADYGYDTARDVVRGLTVISSIVAFVLGAIRYREADRRKLANELIALALIPVAIYFGGTFLINNFGGLGGG